MTLSTTTHTALDGGSVEITSSLARGQHTSSIELRTPYGVREFISGDLSFGRKGARKDFGIGVFEEEYAFQGGRLLLGQDLAEYSGMNFRALRRTAVWEGGNFSVTAHLFWRESTDLIALFDLITISERANGLTITPRDPVATPIVLVPRHSPEILVHAHGLGLLRVYQATPETTAFLPPWGGLPTPGGELFSSDADSFVLVSDSAVSHIYTEGEEATADQITNSLSELRVTWKASSDQIA